MVLAAVNYRTGLPCLAQGLDFIARLSRAAANRNHFVRYGVHHIGGGGGDVGESAYRAETSQVSSSINVIVSTTRKAVPSSSATDETMADRLESVGLGQGVPGSDPSAFAPQQMNCFHRGIELRASSLRWLVLTVSGFLIAAAGNP